ncbi:MAG: hypothetical protein KBA97_05280, partial [Methanothrix sp.]|nr:hypothetical protein [Methanothrix sp.]
GTGILEIALHSQLGIRDRLSAQYVNSNYSGGHAVLCVGYNDRIRKSLMLGCRMMIGENISNP